MQGNIYGSSNLPGILPILDSKRIETKLVVIIMTGQRQSEQRRQPHGERCLARTGMVSDDHTRGTMKERNVYFEDQLVGSLTRDDKLVDSFKYDDQWREGKKDLPSAWQRPQFT